MVFISRKKDHLKRNAVKKTDGNVVIKLSAVTKCLDEFNVLVKLNFFKQTDSRYIYRDIKIWQKRN